jgi:molybdenum cofactor biosynthesis protein B
MVMKQEHLQPVNLSVAIITVSTTRTTENDASGQTIQKILHDAAIPVTHYSIVPDQVEAIRTELYKALDAANCIIIDGGTGLTHDDCTIEAVLPLLEKKIDGFGELFRMKSFQEIGTSAMLSRALGGILHGRAVFCIPGSTPAVMLATRELIVPEIVHILSHANM